MITVENVIHRFRQWAEAHGQIKVFTHGQEPDKDLDKGSSYPLMHAVLLDVNPTAVNTGSIIYNFQVSFLDKPTIEEDKNEQSLYALNDCVMYALDLIATIKNETAEPPIFGDDFVLSSWSVQALQEVNSHVLWGATLNLQLEVDFTHNYCDVPIAPISGGFDPCTLCGLIGNATALQIINCLSSEQQDAIVAELCNASTCDPATYRNSINSFSQEIASGATYTAPDITVTDVDGSTRQVPANVDVEAVFPEIDLETTDGNSFRLIGQPAGKITSWASPLVIGDFNFRSPATQPFSFNDFRPFRAGIRIINADIADVVTVGGDNGITLALIDINNSDGVTLLSPSDLIGDKTLPDIPITDDDGAVGDIAAPTGIVVDGEVDSFSQNAATGVVTITPAGGGAPTNIIPNRVIPSYDSVIYRTGDLGWHWNNGTFDYNDGAGIVQELDPTAGAEYWFRLRHDNPFGNKFRFTDDMGVPAPLGRLDFPTNTTTPNSTGATPAYVIDNLSGLGYVRQPVGTARDWEQSIDFCNAFTLGTYNDFRLLAPADILNVSYAGFAAPTTASLDEFSLFDRGGGASTFDPDNTVINTEHWTSKSRNATQAFRGTFLGFSNAVIGQTKGAYAVRTHF